MRHSTLKKAACGLFGSAALIFLDQLAKRLAVHFLKDQAAIPLWEGVFELRYLENRGAAFGLMQGQRLFFLVMTTVVLIFIVFFYLKQIPDEPRYRAVDVVAILYFSGAVGNFVDRMRAGYVVDFFYFVLIDFPIFNMADIYVVVAAGLLAWLGFFYYKGDEFERMFTFRQKRRGG